MTNFIRKSGDSGPGQSFKDPQPGEPWERPSSADSGCCLTEVGCATGGDEGKVFLSLSPPSLSCGPTPAAPAYILRPGSTVLEEYEGEWAECGQLIPVGSYCYQ